MDNLTQKQCDYLDGYARALADICYALTTESMIYKSYDPMEAHPDKLHSYIFDFKDGVRQHLVEQFEDFNEILSIMVKETVDRIAMEPQIATGTIIKRALENG